MAIDTMDWSALRVGDEVEVHDGDTVVARGIVDNLTEDREIVWLIPSVGNPGRPAVNSNYALSRHMFHRPDGWGVRAVKSER